MIQITVSVDGLAEVQAVLGDLPRATQKSTMRKVLIRRAEPIAATMRSLVRVDQGQLRDSIGVSTKLSRRQQTLHKKAGDRAGVEVFVGAGALPQAITEEFGTDDQSPHPFARPAWDQGKRDILVGLGADMWTEIERVVKRRAATAARRAGRAGRAAVAEALE
jgi:HK97 gp10 family phage protein